MRACVRTLQTEKKHSQATEGEQRLFAEALSRSAQTLNSTLNLQEVLARVIDSVVTVLPSCDLAHVYLLEGGVAYLSRSHAYTEIGKAWENTNPKLDIPSLPNLLKTITDLQPSVISDTRDYPQWIVLPGAEGVRSVVAAAIILDDIAIGLMILNSVVPGTYLPFHGERLQAFANQASIAIRNARLYEEVQHYVDQLELRVGERTAELLETNERLQVILETTAEGICYTRDAKIQYANRAFYELLGYSATLAMTPADSWNCGELTFRGKMIRSLKPRSSTRRATTAPGAEKCNCTAEMAPSSARALRFHG